MKLKIIKQKKLIDKDWEFKKFIYQLMRAHPRKYWNPQN